MFEIFLLVAIILLLPAKTSLLPTVIGVALVIPGAYAMIHGAPYVPTTNGTLRRMLGLAKIKHGEKAYDLGCGDGRIVFAAAKQGADAVGYELSAPTFVFAKFRSLFHRRSSIRFGNIWKQNYRDADVIFCYLLTQPMQTFKRIVWPQLKPGTRVVSHSFKMNGIKPTKIDRDAVLYVK